MSCEARMACTSFRISTECVIIQSRYEGRHYYANCEVGFRFYVGIFVFKHEYVR